MEAAIPALLSAMKEITAMYQKRLIVLNDPFIQEIVEAIGALHDKDKMITAINAEYTDKAMLIKIETNVHASVAMNLVTNRMEKIRELAQDKDTYMIKTNVGPSMGDMFSSAVVNIYMDIEDEEYALVMAVIIVSIPSAQ